MPTDSSFNCFYPIVIQGLNNLVNAIDSTNKTSFKNFGKAELMSDVYIDNGGRLAINKAMNSSNIYYLDVSGNTNFSNIQTTDLVIANKNDIFNVQSITGTSTTLVFGSAENVSVNCPTNSNIYLPTINSITQIGTKFSFYFGSNNYPTVAINSATGQTIIDNIYAQEVSSINISYSRPFLELVCVNYPGKWALCNGANDYNLFPQTSTSNSWSGTNTFSSNLTLTSPAVLFTNYIQTIGSLLLGNPSGSTTNLMTSLVIGSANPFTENSNNPSSGISSINIQTKRGGTLTLGNSSVNNGGNINIYAGQYTISIGGGSSGASGILNLGASSTSGYTLTTNLSTGTSSNILNIGSSSSTINLLGNITANSVSISPTLISYLSGLTGNIQSQLNLLEPITALSNYALLASPTFTGSPKAPTQATTDNTTNIATTAYVKANLSNYSTLTYLASNYPSFTYINSNCPTLSFGNTFTGSQTFNSSGVWNVPSGGSFSLQYNGTTWLQLGSNALYSPISFDPDFGQTTFNGYIVFKSGFTIENNQTLGIGTSGYGTGVIQVAGSGSYINIQNSGGFFTNWIEPSGLYSPASWFTTHTDTLTFGCSNGNIIMAFANTTIQNAISFTGTLNSVSPTVFGYIGGLTSSAQTQINNILNGTSSFTNISYTGTLNSVSPTVFGYISGLTSSAQTQINNILNGTSSHTNITYTGTLNSISTTVLGYISGLTSSAQTQITNAQTQINNLISGSQAVANVQLQNKYWIGSNALISANTTLSFPLANEIYSVSTTSNITITLPTIASSNCGAKVIFKRVGGTTTTSISFIGNGSQSVYNIVMSGGTTAQALIPSGSYVATLYALQVSTTPTYAWCQIA